MAGEQVVLTTGANSGIGLATAIAVARAGFDSVGSVRSAAKARQVRAAAAAAGAEVRTVLLDVREPAACARVVGRLRPWAVVNNAGFPASGAVEDVDDAAARAAFETMVLAPIRLARLALPHMREWGEGRIVNMSSIYGLATTPLTGWYQACKHALEALSDALRIETAGFGVKVVLVEPGGFDTGIWDQANSDIEGRPGSPYAAAYARARSGIELSRPLMGHPDGVARVVVKALQARRPSPRYLVGHDARVIAVYDRLVPAEVKDRLARLALGL
ncbi:MAG: SDR family NAD(P)-dependent oxidoreductase [Chloroflexota bacterium]